MLCVPSHMASVGSANPLLNLACLGHPCWSLIQAPVLEGDLLPLGSSVPSLAAESRWAESQAGSLSAPGVPAGLPSTGQVSLWQGLCVRALSLLPHSTSCLFHGKTTSHDHRDWGVALRVSSLGLIPGRHLGRT